MSTDNSAIEIAKLVVETMKVLAWPLLILSLVIWFNKPITDIVNNLARKFSLANKFSIGSLSLQIEANAREAGNPELAMQVGSLTAGAVEELLRTPRTGDMILISTSDYRETREYGLPKQKTLDSLFELEEKGFLKFRSKIKPYLTSIRKLIKAKMDEENSDRIWYKSPFEVDSSEDKEIRSQGYSLTEQGKQAVDAIVKAVAVQLSEQ